MTKKRVHEIAKEQGLSSKELLVRLKAAGVEAKAAASSVEETVALQALGSNGTPSAAQLRTRPRPLRRLPSPRRPRRPRPPARVSHLRRPRKHRLCRLRLPVKLPLALRQPLPPTELRSLRPAPRERARLPSRTWRPKRLPGPPVSAYVPREIRARASGHPAASGRAGAGAS